MASAATIAELKRLTQKRHRIELNIARLNNQQNKGRQADTRLKLRLGGLLYLIGWETLPNKLLDDQLSDLAKLLVSSRDDTLHSFRIQGENTIRRTIQDRKLKPSSTKMTADSRRLLNHQKISLGGLLIKHKLQTYPRGTLLGALIHLNNSQVSAS